MDHEPGPYRGESRCDGIAISEIHNDLVGGDTAPVSHRNDVELRWHGSTEPRSQQPRGPGEHHGDVLIRHGERGYGLRIRQEPPIELPDDAGGVPRVSGDRRG